MLKNAGQYTQLLLNIYMNNINTKICKKCGVEFEYGTNKKRIFCSHKCANSHNVTDEIKQKISNGVQNFIHKNGKFGALTHNHNIVNHIENTCPICGNNFKVFAYNKQKRIYCSKTCYLKDTNCTYRKAASGGIRKNSSYGKQGYYNGFWCDSTYELAYLIYMIDHGVSVIRNLEGFKYVWEGKEYTYFPDFIVNGRLVEIKGYHSQKTDVKMQAVTKPIDILYKEDLFEIFEYVKNKTNLSIKRLYELYDEYKPEYTYICNGCGKEFGTNKKRKTEMKYCSRKCIKQKSHSAIGRPGVPQTPKMDSNSI